MVEFLFQGGFLSDFLHEFESHGFEILFEELISVIFEESGTVVIGVEQVVAVVESELTVFILLEGCFAEGSGISGDVGFQVAGE